MNYYCDLGCREVERAGIVVLYNNKILTVLGKVSNKWGLPKGEICVNENIVDAAIRELYEETGLVVDDEMKKSMEPFFSTKYTIYFKLDITNKDFVYSPKIIDRNEIKKCKFSNIHHINKMYSNHDLRFLANNVTTLLK